MADKEKIGVVGTGRMGQAMVHHLIKNGYAVVAQDIAPKAVEAARALGAATVKTPAVVGKAWPFVIVAVGYDDEATAVMAGPGGLLETMGTGSVIGVSSTCTPEHVKMLAEKARAKGVEVLDAPICRGQMAADTGTMNISACRPASSAKDCPGTIARRVTTSGASAPNIGLSAMAASVAAVAMIVNGDRSRRLNSPAV
jgi:3-hydroxyisobutyrate dehydrogenase-like beta-hydroxyacid dehydrogenase